MDHKSSHKVLKYKRPIRLNIGIVLFAIIFLYLIFYVYTYLTTSHVSSYEVTTGSIAQDTIFTGLILRNETLYYAEKDGYVNYYCREGNKSSAGSYIYSIDESGEYYRKAMAASMENLTDETYDILCDVARQFQIDYDEENFNRIYQFKYDMEATLLEAYTATQAETSNAADNTTDHASSGTALEDGLYAYKTPEAGIVVYSTDGYESVTTDTFNADMFQKSDYRKTSFLKQENIAAGDPVYKLITNETWNVVVPINNELTASLADTESIQVEFQEDGSTSWADAAITYRDGTNYLILTFNNSMIRFAQDRYVELELMMDDTSGLKIPNTAITTKDFLLIPKDYVTKGGNSSSDGVLLEKKGDGTTDKAAFVAITLLLEGDDFYCIASSELEKGDVIRKPDSQETYTINQTKALEGVYNINKGYAVFKRIERLYQNEEYTIVRNDTGSGISLYDHIALEADTVTENEIIQ